MVRLLSFLFILWNMLELGWLMMPDIQRKEKRGNLMGFFDVYKKTWKSDGLVGLYRGFSIACVEIVVYRGWYFGLYDSLKLFLLLGDL